jgi:hypothetical protein
MKKRHSEFEGIVMNVVSAIQRGELTQATAADLLNDFQDHEFEERRKRMSKHIARRQFNIFRLFSKIFGRVDYYKYIKSPEWKRKANAAKKRAGYRCQVCNHGRDEGARLEAHHRTYARLGHEKPEDITVLCSDCHELYEVNKRQS